MTASTTLPLSGDGGNLGNENMIASTTLPCQVLRKIKHGGVIER